MPEVIRNVSTDPPINPPLIGGDGIDYNSISGVISADININNLQFTADEINTIQDIDPTATPTFGGLTVTGLSGVVKATAGVISGLADTDDLPEGSSNLYYTDTRVRNALSGGDGITYTSGTGAIAADINATNLKFTANEINTIQDITIASNVQHAKLGLGAAPAEVLHLGAGNILGKGIFGAGDVISVSGAGERLIWYPRKAAFRAGSVTGSQWDDANIGSFSVAMGENSKASATHSFCVGSGTIASDTSAVAFGKSTTSSGDSSIAMGNLSSASGDFSIAMGNVCSATGAGSVALGNNTTTSKPNAVAMGLESTASGNAAVAIGDNCVASGNNSVAIGKDSTASGVGAVLIGIECTASGANSVTLGNGSSSTGNNSAALGFNSTSQPYASLAIGRYNTLSGTIGSWVTTDPLLILGNGVSSGSRSDAFVVFKDGKASINTSSSVEVLTANGALALVDGMTAPSVTSGWAKLYVDTADGDLKIIFGDGTIKTIATDT